jgi:hypothetical protein
VQCAFALQGSQVLSIVGESPNHYMQVISRSLSVGALVLLVSDSSTNRGKIFALYPDVVGNIEQNHSEHTSPLLFGRAYSLGESHYKLCRF